MGDRVYVNLTVLAEHEKRVLELIAEDPEELSEGSPLIVLGFTEINYGTLPNLDLLQEAGIPFDSEWDAGGDFTKGGDFLRFTPEGEADRKEVYDEDKGVPLHLLMDVLDDHEALKQRILGHRERVGILPWDNQAEYGRIYRTKQLINPE